VLSADTDFLLYAGAIIKFITRIPYWLNLGLGIGKWHCEFREGPNGRVSSTDVFGGKAPKEAWNMLVVKPKKIVRVDYETKRIDLLGEPLYWRN
jgi:hypothetical protein